MTIIKTALPNKKAIFIKLGFVIGLILLGLVSYGIASGKLKNNGVVLGKKTTVQDPVDNTPRNMVQQVQATADNLKNDAYRLAQSAAVAVGDTATSSATAVKEYIFMTTVSSAVKQLDGLPPDVMKQIKENICK